MFVHKYEARLAKDISTLQTELDMLKPGERNQYNESREYTTAELALLKQMAGMIERFNHRQMRQAIDRMSRSRGKEAREQ